MKLSNLSLVRSSCILAPLLALACSSSQRVERLRAAVDEARLPLVESVGIAESSLEQGRAIKAQLDVNTSPVYAVGALSTGQLSDVRVDIVKGTVLSTTALGPSSEPCPGSISLAETISIAEQEVDGQAVSVAPDDDNACNREVQVLADILWEVKVAPDGAVLETEESDDN